MPDDGPKHSRVAASLLRSIAAGALVGVGADALLLLGQLSDPELAAHPLGVLDAALLILGGAVAGGAYHLMRDFAARSVVHDYVTWGLVSALGAAFLGVADFLASGSPKVALGVAAFGFAGGLGARVTVRYLLARSG